MPAPDLGQELAALYLNRDANLLASFGNRAGTDVTPTVGTELIPPVGGTQTHAQRVLHPHARSVVRARRHRHLLRSRDAARHSPLRRPRGRRGRGDHGGPAPHGERTRRQPQGRTLQGRGQRLAALRRHGRPDHIRLRGRDDGEGNPFGCYFVSAGAPVVASEDRHPWERIMAGASVAAWNTAGLPAKRSAGNDAPGVPSVVFWCEGGRRSVGRRGRSRAA